jgi:hypothetical protein
MDTPLDSPYFLPFLGFFYLRLAPSEGLTKQDWKEFFGHITKFSFFNRAAFDITRED